MRERIIRVGVLAGVFVLAFFISLQFVNRENIGTTADMEEATFPVISFEIEGKEVNVLAGHKNEMDISAMRDTITPIEENGTIQGNIQLYADNIDSVQYEVYTVDGKEKLLEKTEDNVESSVDIEVGNVIEEGEEAVLKIALNLDEDESVYYYTRVIQPDSLHMDECMEYVQTLHDNMMENLNTNDLKRVLESDATGDNTTLQHVNIHSDLEHATWGSLNPEVASTVRWDILETKEAYTSILLSYKVKCAGDNNEEEFFEIKEFFRVSHSEGKNYLLTYDRTMNEIFDGSKVVLMSKGINLGLTSADTQYKVNQDGTIVSFVQNRELWSYNKEESEFALVFSFAHSETEDVRNANDNHLVKILSVEENGNVTFGVYGYMNRGLHEGESGVAIYYFNLAQNTVEEKAFIPSTNSQPVIEEELGELAYYNNETNILYLLASGILYKIDLLSGEQTILLEGLETGKYVSSNDGQMIAYQKNEEATEVEVLNFKEDSTMSVKAGEGEIVIPLGFIFDDFVYGVSRPEYVGMTSSGEMVSAMYKVEICDSQNTVVKTYQVDGTYVLDAVIEGNMITLERATKQGETYVGILEDYITNNEESTNSVSLQSYWTNLKETQMRLVFEDGIKNKKANVLKPKQVIFEQETTMALEQNSDEKFYSVYGLGRIAGVYTEAGDAIQKAKEVSGVVVSPQQAYIWEDGNRVAWYRNFEMRAFTNKAGESTLAASVRAVLAYAGKEVDVAAELQTKTAFEVFSENIEGEAVRMEECSASDVRYLIDKGTPVIAMTGSTEAVVLIGYDAVSVTYIEPTTGAVRIRNFAVVDEMMSGSGNTFIGYVK